MPDEFTLDMMKEGMDFYRCLRLIAEGKKARRLAWPNDGAYISFSRDKLGMILTLFKPSDKGFHALFLSHEDVQSTDWEILEDQKTS